MKKIIISAVSLVIVGLVGLLVSGDDKAVVPAIKPTKSYVALGDSVAAGVGLKDDSDSSACNRTNEAYPYQVAASLNYKLTSIACSGATIPAGILGKQNVNELLVDPQLQQLFSQSKPDLVSLTIGANDIGWTNIIAKCYTGTCGSDADTADIHTNITTMSDNLQTVLRQIQSHYGSSIPRVVVTGYHQVFPTAVKAGCTDLTGIDENELSWGRQVQADLSTAIENVTKEYSFVTYTPVDFTGHELCTADPWVQGLADKQPYHPTQAGQAEFAKQIVRSVNGQKQ